MRFLRSALQIAPLFLLSGYGMAAVVDITAQNSTGIVGGAFIEQFTLSSAAGTGVINSFLKIDGRDQEKGYNTTGVLEFDTTNAHAIQLQDIPLVSVNNGNYYEFFLDTNQSNPQLISLDTLQLFTAGTSNQTGYTGGGTFIGSAGNIFDTASDSALLSDEWGAGSGKGDYLVYIPQSAFTGAAQTDYVYLYSAFGAITGANNNGGFEEWYVSGSSTVSIGGGTVVTATPEPSAWFLAGIGLMAVAGLARRRRVAA